MPRPPKLGDVLIVALLRLIPPGHEQEGQRPAIVVGLSEKVGPPRYPMIIAVPLTTEIGAWAKRSPSLYPHLLAGTGGLPYPSIVMLDHLRGVDAQRVVRYLGSLSPKELALIQEGLKEMFGL